MEQMPPLPADVARPCDNNFDVLRSVAAKLMLASNWLARSVRPDPAALHARGSAVPAQKRLGHVPALDGLRGVAIASVLIYHAGGLSGGYLGVDLFFVLSGFLITSFLLEEHLERGRVSLRNFYVRRLRRLMPVAIAGIVFSEIALLGGYIGWQALSGVFALFYVENLAHFLHDAPVTGVGHYWSLSQEEQFYLLWPPCLVLMLHRRVNPRWVLAGLLLAALGVMAHRTSLHDALRLYGPDVRSDGMLLGCALAVAWKSGLVKPRSGWRFAGVAAAAMFAAAVYSATWATGERYGVTAANLAALTMIASVIAAPRGWLPRLLSFQPLRWLGVISYSLYIWQPLVVSVTELHGAVMLAVATPIGWGSYQFIERPFRLQSRARLDRNEITSTPAPAPSAAAV
jgi:peptidoglycan/LPS O-acetylase OafA/YrhL